MMREKGKKHFKEMSAFVRCFKYPATVHHDFKE